jgi:hypothetical protein
MPQKKAPEQPPEKTIRQTGIVNFDPDCVRKTSNWSKPSADIKFDNSGFNAAKINELIPTHSPKKQALLK